MRAPRLDPEADVVRGRVPAVLVVEGDPDSQWRLARLLTVSGSRVVGASTGTGAMALMAQCAVDLVLVDDSLPGATGLEVVRAIRDAHPNIRVVLMSRDATTDVRDEAELAGANVCVTKPLGVEMVRSLIREAT